MYYKFSFMPNLNTSCSINRYKINDAFSIKCNKLTRSTETFSKNLNEV